MPIEKAGISSSSDQPHDRLLATIAYISADGLTACTRYLNRIFMIDFDAMEGNEERPSVFSRKDPCS